LTSASLHERIAAARDTLVRAGLPPSDAAVDAAVLARHALGWDRATLLARGREAPPPSFDSPFASLVARRAAREPVAMITGVREFWGLDFEVTPDVLVPRPETELIVEAALNEFPAAPGRIIDVGTGTGCLAIALSREFATARVIATDISAAALAVAGRNARRHEVAARVSFVRTSFLSGLAANVADLIVANPPYVPSSAAAALAPEVVRHEPHTALFGGEDGLAPIRQILATAASHLTVPGRLLLEFGLGQEPEVRALADGAGWRVLRVCQDLQGIQRTIVLGRRS
jgi:release factor glutamine methyltransferase